ncbi:MFS family permease [Kitasatospora sp. MAP12-15]|uniref:MFS transporter n=1 Tax=unclassified Kitasatospora TaxID=2633591 RepID=UPI002474BCD2|nr:MFS transporter [Kitasatospora sp. MAP12-44]MDH6108901.1 MFS family permease [Kitasatospora sp. MAP12-44]
MTRDLTDRDPTDRHVVAGDPTDGRRGIRPLLADRNVRWFLLGQLVSVLGDTMLWLVAGIWVKELTGSNSAAALAFFLVIVGTLCAPLGGMVADRYRRRRLLLVLNLATAAVLPVLLLVHSSGRVWLVYLVMLLYGLSNSFLDPAQAGLLRVLVPEERLGDANGLLQTAKQSLRLVSPLAGAGLFAALGAHAVVLVDTGTFLVAAATLLAVRLHEDAPSSSGSGWRTDITEGIRHLANTLVLRQLSIGCALTMVGMGLAETVGLAVVGDGLGRPPAFLGVLLVGQGAGAVLAGLTAGRIARRIGDGPLVAAGMASFGLGALLQTVPSVAVVATGMVLCGASMPWIAIGLTTIGFRHTPPELVGRVYAGFTLIMTVPQVLAMAVGAALIAAVDFRVVLVGMAVTVAAAAGYLFTRPEQRWAKVDDEAVREAVSETEPV